VSIQTQLERKTAEAELVGAPKTSSMSSISSIFGNAEVLEA
jgi:hypothetical protein